MSQLTPSYSRGEVCVVDPGGDDRVPIATESADHSPGDDPDAQDEVLAPVADAMLAAVGLRPGDTVIDLGCGCGATTLRAAQAVGPHGGVYGIDLTESMLAVARERLAHSGAGGVELVAGDVATHGWPRPFDAAISRFGTMFFADPVAAFTNIAGGLRPGGRLCIATWQSLEANDWLVIPGVALLPWIILPDFSGGGPGMFAQSDTTTVSSVLEAAGFVDIEIEPMTITLPFGSNADDALERLRDTGVGRAALDAVRDADRPAALAAVRAALAECSDAEGVRLNAGILLSTALRP